MPHETLHFTVKLKVEILRRVHNEPGELRPDRPLELKDSTLTHHVVTTLDTRELLVRQNGRAETVLHIVTDSVRNILGDGMLMEVLTKTAGLLAKDT